MKMYKIILTEKMLVIEKKEDIFGILFITKDFIFMIESTFKIALIRKY